MFAGALGLLSILFRDHMGSAGFWLGNLLIDVFGRTAFLIVALLGAAGMQDIGTLFPDTEAAFEGADRVQLLGSVIQLLGERGWRPVNVDAVVVCEEPRIAPHRQAMCERLAGAMGLDVGDVTVRGTTTEGMGFTGRGEGIAAQAVALVQQSGGTRSAGAEGEGGPLGEEKG